MDLRVGEDVATGDAVLVGAVAPAVRVGVGVPARRDKRYIHQSVNRTPNRKT